MNTQLKALDDLLVTLKTDDQLLAVAQMRQIILIDQRAVAQHMEAIDRAVPLPPIIPLNPKRVGPGHFKCPLCKAKPGNPCVKISNRGTARAEGDDSIGAPLSGGVYHTARQELSKEANR